MQHTSVPKIPQQNERIERKHWHLIDTARALKLHVNLPDKFWGDYVLPATHLINKLPSVVLKWKTSYKCLFKKPSDYSMLKVVGCLCYALDMQSGRDKFSPKGRRCIFLSYPSHQKAYQLYDLDAHTTFVRRNVKFLEHIFPYHSSKAVPAPQYIFLSYILSSLDDTDSFPSSNSYPTYDPISQISSTSSFRSIIIFTSEPCFTYCCPFTYSTCLSTYSTCPSY